VDGVAAGIGDRDSPARCVGVPVMRGLGVDGAAILRAASAWLGC